MALIVIDHGNRIQTPIRSIFPDRGVESTSPAKATHDSAGMEKRLHADGEPFTQLLDSELSNNNKRTRELGPDTYSPEKKPAPSRKLKAAQIMSHPVQTIAREATFKNVWMRMRELHISHLMVVDNNKHPVGIISKDDVIEYGKESPVSIANFYTRKLIAASPETDVSVISATFIEFDINAMPVFDHKDQLLGIVCRSDLLRLLISGSHIESWA